MNDIIRVELKSSETYSYDIEIGHDLFNKLAQECEAHKIAYRYAVISDSNVSNLYFHKLSKSLIASNLDHKLITFPAGEMSKTRSTKGYIEDRMLESNMGRDTAVIALGGGVVGDIAGFVAATYNRGIKYIQYPTSLVACVDSSIGGKTGIDTIHGKNLIGSFHQPHKVYIDLNTLSTLNTEQIKEGMAEVIKYGVIYDNKLFKFIEDKLGNILARDPQSLREIIKASCEIKAYVVENDEKESNLRKILNFGHTLGHAIEQLSNYQITHGNAIAIGMVLEAKIANILNLLNPEDVTRIKDIIDNTSLPTSIPSGIDRSRLIDTMKLDKKARKGLIEFALPYEIGAMHSIEGQYGIKVDENIIKKVIYD